MSCPSPCVCCVSSVCFLNRGHSGSNVSHIVILRPLKSGYFNFTSADISYMASDESEEPQVGPGGCVGVGGGG